MFISLRIQKSFFLSLVFIISIGCASTSEKKEPQTDEDFFNKAMELYKKNDHWQAAPTFTELRDKFPLSKYAVIAELRLADIHYFKAEYIEAIHFYEEFKRLHPSNPDVPYAILQLGMCNFKQIELIDRDQTPAENAANYFYYLITHYPTSPFTGIAMGKYKICRERMFAHDFYIGSFYYKTKEYWAAKERFLEILPHYPYVREKDKVFFYLGNTYLQLNEEKKAKDTLLKLIEDFPQSEYRAEAKFLIGIPLEPEEKEQLKMKQKKKRFIIF